MVVIAQAAHHLAAHLSARSFLEFVVIFGLIWIAWLNGTIYHDLHGQEDGRTRTFVFVQMGILALLAVFTGDAAGSSGMAFALTYVAFFLVMTWLWYGVRRRDSEEYMALTARYLFGMVVTTAVMALSAFMEDDLRLLIWALVAIGWVAGTPLLSVATERSGAPGPRFTFADSGVERFGLFTIIVLGEVVVGVVDGLGEAELDALTITTGMIALVVGFGLWWIFFDHVGRRLPRDGSWATLWMTGHLPVALGIAAAGAGMVSLIEHAHDARTPVDTAWLLAGAVTLALAGMIAISRSLVDYVDHADLYRPVSRVMGIAAIAALFVGWLRPAPWLLALLLVAILSAIWIFAVDRWLRIQRTTDPPVSQR